MIKKGDHLYTALVQKPQHRCVLRVKSVETNGTIVAKPAPEYHISDVDEVTLKVQNDPNILIIANLGSNPAVSSIGGCNTRSYIGTKTLDGYGKVYFFYKPSSKEDMKFIIDGLESAKERLAANNIEFALKNVHISIHNSLSMASTNTMLGCYDRKYKNICIFADRIQDQNESMTHTILHEFAHFIYSLISKQKELATDWTEAFYEISSKVEASADDLKRYAENFLVSGQDLSSYVKSLDNENEDYTTGLTERQLFKKYLAISAKYYGLSYKDLVLFSKQDRFDLLEHILMDNITPVTVRVINKAKSTSQYSTKNIKEFFAEALAYYLEGTKIQQRLTRLSERTLGYARRCITEDKEQ